MRNRRWPDILTGVLLAIAVFAIGYSVSSARYLSGRETGEHNQKQISNLADVLIAVWDYLTKDAITLFTIVLAVATWLLLLVAGSVKTKTVHFSGWVRYVDVFGNRYISGFHYVFDPIGERFVRRGSAEYNYTREE